MGACGVIDGWWEGGGHGRGYLEVRTSHLQPLDRQREGVCGAPRCRLQLQQPQLGTAAALG